MWDRGLRSTSVGAKRSVEHSIPVDVELEEKTPPDVLWHGTGDDRNPLIWLLLLGIGGCMAGAAWNLRKKDEKVLLCRT